MGLCRLGAAACLAFLALLASCAPARTPDSLIVVTMPPETLELPAGYQLVWSDEFDRPSLPAPDKWTYDTHRNRSGWYNAEAQYYARARADNTRVEDGRLVIEAHAETLDRKRFRDWGGQRYSSGRLVTRGRAGWTYGFFEVSARMPCTRGTWPGIWLFPLDDDGVWGAGEIDLAEHVGLEPGVVHHSVHTSARNFLTGDHPTARSAVPDACTAFHRYQLLWTQDRIVMGVDGRAAFAAARREAGGEWPFRHPMYLILNLAVGGTWAGRDGIDDAGFPARLEIDYVRVYQAEGREG
ncbi:MAG: family 16 glycosylhydrolase [Sphingomonadales bacterium]